MIDRFESSFYNSFLNCKRNLDMSIAITIPASQRRPEAPPASFCNTHLITKIFINAVFVAVAAGLITTLVFTEKYGWPVPVSETAMGLDLLALLSYNLPSNWRRLQQYVTVLLLYPLFYALWQIYFIKPEDKWSVNGLMAAPVIFVGTQAKELVDAGKQVWRGFRKPPMPFLAGGEKIQAVSLLKEMLRRENVFYMSRQLAYVSIGTGLLVGTRYIPSPWAPAASIPGLQLVGGGSAGLLLRTLYILASHWGKHDASRWRHLPGEGTPLLSTAARTTSISTLIIQKLFAPFSIISFILGIRVHKLFLVTSGAFTQCKEHEDTIQFKAATIARLDAERNPHNFKLLKIASVIEIAVGLLIGIGNPLYTFLRLRGSYSNPIAVITGVTLVSMCYISYIATKVTQNALRLNRWGGLVPFSAQMLTYAPTLLGILWINFYVLSFILPSPGASFANELAWAIMSIMVGNTVGNISFLPPPDPNDEERVEASVSPIAQTGNLLLMLSQPSMFVS